MAAFTVGTTPVRISTTEAHDQHRDSQVIVENNDTNAVFLGPRSDVTTSTGSTLPAGESIGFATKNGREIWAVSVAGTAANAVRVNNF